MEYATVLNLGWMHVVIQRALGCVGDVDCQGGEKGKTSQFFMIEMAR